MALTTNDLDRLLVTMDVSVQSFAICEIKNGFRLVGAPQDAIMVHYVLAGTMHMEVPGHPPLTCGAGSIALIPPRLAPTLAAGPGAAVDVIAADNTRLRDGLLVMDAAGGGAGDLRIAAGSVVASVSGSFGLLDRLKRPVAESCVDLAIVREIYFSMLEELGRPRLGSRAFTSSLMKTCLLIVLRRILARPDVDSSLIGALADARLGAAVAAVLERPSEPHTVASLAAGAGMSRSSFARAFREAFEVSPMEFVAKSRLRHAADMLRSTQLPIKVIAASTGFASRSHFSKAFRDGYGDDPTSFRRDSRNEPLDGPGKLYGSRERFGLAAEPDEPGVQVR